MHYISVSPTLFEPTFSIMQDADMPSPNRPMKTLNMQSRISFADVCFSSRCSAYEDNHDSMKKASTVGNKTDCSIFEPLNGDAYEPISLGKPRTSQQEAALTAMLEESVRYLFPPSNKNKKIVNDDSPIMCKNKSSAFDRDRSLVISDTEERGAKRQRLSLDEYSTLRFRDYQEEAWTNHFQDLLEFKAREGHCSVPYKFQEKPSLARWVKRQRFQYRLRIDGKSSTMTARRIKLLEDVGFVWDSHSASWGERLRDLKQYRAEHGNCNVPTQYKRNKKLATWVKCQRRQYKLFLAGRPSTMNTERIDVLHELGFSWDMRSSKKENPSRS